MRDETSWYLRMRGGYFKTKNGCGRSAVTVMAVICNNVDEALGTRVQSVVDADRLQRRRLVTVIVEVEWSSMRRVYFVAMMSPAPQSIQIIILNNTIPSFNITSYLLKLGISFHLLLPLLNVPFPFVVSRPFPPHQPK